MPIACEFLGQNNLPEFSPGSGLCEGHPPSLCTGRASSVGSVEKCVLTKSSHLSRPVLSRPQWGTLNAGVDCFLHVAVLHTAHEATQRRGQECRFWCQNVAFTWTPPLTLWGP